MSKKATDILAYIGPIGLIIALLFGDREASKVHLNQALVLYLIDIIANVILKVLRHVPVLGTLWSIVVGILGLVTFVLWIMGLVAAIRGQDKELPIVGGIKLF